MIAAAALAFPVSSVALTQESKLNPPSMVILTTVQGNGKTEHVRIQGCIAWIPDNIPCEEARQLIILRDGICGSIETKGPICDRQYIAGPYPTK